MQRLSDTINGNKLTNDTFYWNRFDVERQCRESNSRNDYCDMEDKCSKVVFFPLLFIRFAINSNGWKKYGLLKRTGNRVKQATTGESICEHGNMLTILWPAVGLIEGFYHVSRNEL